MGPKSSIIGVLIQRGNVETHRDTGTHAHCAERRGAASGATTPANASILDFQPPELPGNECLGCELPGR